jgi:hypothetical protein
MTLDDLEYIFKPQIFDDEAKLYYMIIDGNFKEIMRCHIDKLAEEVIFLDNFIFDGYIESELHATLNKEIQ